MSLPKLPLSPAAALLILNIALLLALLLAILISPAPRVDSSFGGARVSISANRSWTIRPGQCAIVSWELEGIQSVYVNGAGKIGQGAQELCPAPGAATVEFSITAGDGDRRSFTIPLHDLASYGVAWLPMMGLLLPLLAALWYLASMRLEAPPVHLGRAILASLALLLGGSAAAGGATRSHI